MEDRQEFLGRTRGNRRVGILHADSDRTGYLRGCVNLVVAAIEEVPSIDIRGIVIAEYDGDAWVQNLREGHVHGANADGLHGLGRIVAAPRDPRFSVCIIGKLRECLRGEVVKPEFCLKLVLDAERIKVRRLAENDSVPARRPPRVIDADGNSYEHIYAYAHGHTDAHKYAHPHDHTHGHRGSPGH